MLAERQARICPTTTKDPAPWLMVDQVHGVGVHHADGDDEWPLAAEADVVVVSPDVVRPVAIWAADCAPLVLFGRGGTVVGAHAGWVGLAQGVIDLAVEALRDAGDDVGAVVVGPVIHACCYEFGAADLDAVAAGVHAPPAAIRARTRAGSAGLDVPSAVRAALRQHGLAPSTVGPCTGCDERFFSHRVRGERERHAVVAWFESGSLSA